MAKNTLLTPEQQEGLKIRKEQIKHAKELIPTLKKAGISTINIEKRIREAETLTKELEKL